MKLIMSAICAILGGAAIAGAEPASYAILSSEPTAADPGWAKVVAALEAKYPGAAKITFPAGKPAEALDKLRELHPRYTCFVARNEEVTREFVTQVHQLTRGLDDDPYADTQWGILTGFDVAGAAATA